jgi:hypothetical protein
MGTTDKEHGIKSKSKTSKKKKSTSGSKINKWINAQLESKGLSISEAKKDAGKYKTISAAKKAGSLYYTNPKGTVMIAAFASDLDSFPPKKEIKKKDTSKKEKMTMRKKAADYVADLQKKGRDVKKSKEVGKSVNITDEQRRSRNKGKVDSTASVTVVSDTKGFNPIGGILKSIKSGPEQVTEKNKREAAALKKINALQKKILQKLDAKDIERFLRIKNGAGSNVGKFNQLKTFERKVKNMNMGGLTSSAMQNGLSRKINPSTGLTMNKGGMTDYRSKGMFYGGGMTRRGR